MKITGWYPGHIKPVRKGVYQQLSGGSFLLGYQYWDGKKWKTWSETIDGAKIQNGYAAKTSQDDKWRGIAK